MMGLSGIFAYWTPKLAFWIGSGKGGEQVRFSFNSKSFYPVLFAVIAAGLSWVIQWKLGTGLEGWMAMVLIWLLMVITLTDIWFFLIPNVVTYSGFLFFMLLRCFLDPFKVTGYLLGGLFITTGLSLVSRISRGLGWGDVKLIAMAAWVVEWPQLLISIWFATLSSMFHVAGRIKYQGRASIKKPIPFGPHLATGMILSLLCGDILWNWYQEQFLYFSCPILVLSSL